MKTAFALPRTVTSPGLCRVLTVGAAVKGRSGAYSVRTCRRAYCPGQAASLVERRGPEVLASAHASKSAARYKGFRPIERNSGPPPRQASFARVAGAVLKPRSVRKAAAFF